MGLPRLLMVSCDRGVPLHGAAGGVHIRGMVSGFVALGFEVLVLAARLQGAGPFVDCAAPVEPLPRGRLPGVLRRARPRWDRRVDARAASRAALVRARAFQPALVYERYALHADAGARIREALGVPALLEVNAPRVWEAALFEGMSPHRGDQVEEDRAWRSADRLVVVSDSLARRAVHRGVATERIVVAPNGADVTRVSRSGAHPFRLGFAGTFKARHGLLESLPALGRLARGRGGLVLELHGDGPLKADFIEALRSYPEVTVAARGWSTPGVLADAMDAWDAAWVPSPMVPVDAAVRGRCEAAFGEPIPEPWFDPLKGAEARAREIPVWDGAAAEPSFDPRPVASWTDVARNVLAGLQWTGP